MPDEHGEEDYVTIRTKPELLTRRPPWWTILVIVVVIGALVLDAKTTF